MRYLIPHKFKDTIRVTTFLKCFEVFFIYRIWLPFHSQISDSTSQVWEKRLSPSPDVWNFFIIHCNLEISTNTRRCAILFEWNGTFDLSTVKHCKNRCRQNKTGTNIKFRRLYLIKWRNLLYEGHYFNYILANLENASKV